MLEQKRKASLTRSLGNNPFLVSKACKAILFPTRKYLSSVQSVIISKDGIFDDRYFYLCLLGSPALWVSKILIPSGWPGFESDSSIYVPRDSGKLVACFGDSCTYISSLWLKHEWQPLLLATNYKSDAYSGFLIPFWFCKKMPLGFVGKC